MAGRIRSTSSEEPRRAAPSPLTSQGCFFQADYTLKFCGLGKHELAPAPVSPITATRRPGPWGGLRERRAFSAHWARLGFCSLVAASPSAHLKRGRVNPPGATAGWTILSVGGHEAHTLQGSRRAPAGRAPRGPTPATAPRWASPSRFLCPPSSLLLRMSRKINTLAHAPASGSALGGTGSTIRLCPVSLAPLSRP